MSRCPKPLVLLLAAAALVAPGCRKAPPKPIAPISIPVPPAVTRTVPPIEPAAPTPVYVGPEYRYELLGIADLGAGASVNILDREQKRSRWIKIGESADGLEVLSADPMGRSAVVKRGTQTATLRAARTERVELSAGADLKDHLKDLSLETSSAYTVINPRFIEALGITDLQEAASWQPGQTIVIDSSNGRYVPRQEAKETTQ